MTIFSKATKTLIRNLKRVAGVEVEYRRGSAKVTTGADGNPLKAVRTRPDFSLSAISGNVTASSNAEDWLFDPDDLVLDGQAIEPRRGDIVLEKATSNQWALRSSGDEPPFRWSDGQKTFLRCHTIDCGAVIDDPETTGDDNELLIGTETDPEVS